MQNSDPTLKTCTEKNSRQTYEMHFFNYLVIIVIMNNNNNKVLDNNFINNYSHYIIILS